MNQTFKEIVKFTAASTSSAKLSVAKKEVRCLKVDKTLVSGGKQRVEKEVRPCVCKVLPLQV